jgi:hypothetical protein
MASICEHFKQISFFKITQTSQPICKIDQFTFDFSQRCPEYHEKKTQRERLADVGQG